MTTILWILFAGLALIPMCVAAATLLKILKDRKSTKNDINNKK